MLAAPTGREILSAAVVLNADEILKHVQAPAFPERKFAITQFGAVGDASMLYTRAIANAIRTCSQAGGGSVIVPRGRFPTGPVHLDHNVNLHLEERATLAFSTNPKDYLPVVFRRFEGTECMNYSPFIYAFEKTNIAITGKGVLDGQAGPEHTGDDCIAVKAGRNRDGRRVNVPCENLLISNCVVKDGHGGVSIGSEVSGGIRNILIENCKMSSPNLERALRIKTNSYRGGVTENVGFRDVTVGEVKEAVIEVDYFYERSAKRARCHAATGRAAECLFSHGGAHPRPLRLYQKGEGGPFAPAVRGIEVANVTSQKNRHAIFMRGYKNSPVGGVTVANCKFENCAEGTFFENVEDVEFRNVTVNGRLLEERRSVA